MKLFLLLCLASIVYSAPAPAANGLGQYNFEFQTSDGIVRKEKSEVVNAGDPENEYLIVRGEFSYVGSDGVTYTVTYIADENGFHPQGEYLPRMSGEEKEEIMRQLNLPPNIQASLLGR